MKTWSISQAQSDIGQILVAALETGPQRIEMPGNESVVVVPQADWQRLASEYPTLALLVLNAPIEEGDLPGRLPSGILGRDLF